MKRAFVTGAAAAALTLGTVASAAAAPLALEPAPAPVADSGSGGGGSVGVLEYAYQHGGIPELASNLLSYALLSPSAVACGLSVDCTHITL
ncbi:hypothetical protein ACWEOI_33775 [Nocardia sp. NPDC004340]|uniref:hypothetical protein n=1 Tax=Nocardia sp. CA-136227 TaxID=3239979 RepID=UPI003D9A0854